MKNFLKVSNKCSDENLALLNPYNWNSRTETILRNCQIKWSTRLHHEDPILPAPYINQVTQDIKYLPSKFISLIKLFSGKCKYCGIFRVSPNHLIKAHNIIVHSG